MRYFAVGDVHGCVEALKALLEILPIKWGEDFLIFLGDYIDRGPAPRAVLELVQDLVERYPQTVIPLKGNHEWMFNRYLQGIEPEVFLYNGGETTLRAYFENGRLVLPDKDRIFLTSLPLYYETSDYLFVHAGIRPQVPLAQQKEEDLLWIREAFYAYPGRFEKVVVFGHTPFPEPLELEDRIGIDTGCVYGGNLSAVELPARKFYQVPCLRRWL